MKKYRWYIAQWFEEKWWKNYLKGKSPDEYLDWKIRYWTDFLAKISFSFSGIEEPIIDIGCGPAGIFIAFPKKNVTALDPLLANYSKLGVFDLGDYPKVNFVEQRFEDFQGNISYQTVFCLNAINHFTDLQGSFKKLYAITGNHGQVVVSIDAHNYGFFRKLFEWIPLDILHPHQYSLNEYEAFMTNSGFQVKKKVLMKKAFFFDYWVLIAEKKLANH